MIDPIGEDMAREEDSGTQHQRTGRAGLRDDEADPFAGHREQDAEGHDEHGDEPGVPEDFDVTDDSAPGGPVHRSSGGDIGDGAD